MFDNLSGIDINEQSVVIQVLDRQLATTKRSEDIDRSLMEEIVALSAEAVVWLLVNLNDNIARCDAWRLIGFAVEGDCLTALHALVDVHLHNLLLANDFAAVARLALVLVVDDLARTRALVTGRLHLLNHRSHLAQGDANTTTGAPIASAYRALLPALAIALGTDDVPRERKLGGLSLVKILERDVDAMHEIFCPPRALRASTTTTKETASATSTE
jgi:hypothetical protein